MKCQISKLFCVKVTELIQFSCKADEPRQHMVNKTLRAKNENWVMEMQMGLAVAM